MTDHKTIEVIGILGFAGFAWTWAALLGLLQRVKRNERYFRSR